MSAEKSRLRKQVLAYRKLLSIAEYDQRCEALLRRCVDLLEKKNIQVFHVFLPIQKNKEPNTWPLLDWAKTSNRTAIVSATDFESETMSHYVVDDSLKFESDRFGIPTPMNGQFADLQKVQLVFIPLLAADLSGNRIGYGKGYYDRLLPQMPAEVLKIGINLAPLFDDFPFAEAHDVRLDGCITPIGLFTSRNL